MQAPNSVSALFENLLYLNWETPKEAILAVALPTRHVRNTPCWNLPAVGVSRELFSSERGARILLPIIVPPVPTKRDLALRLNTPE